MPGPRPLDDLLRRAAPPAPDGGKEARGTVLVIGGAASCPGGALLAGLGALRGGAGRVQLAVHPAVAPHLGVALPEALVLSWDHAAAAPAPVAERAATADAVLIGPGLGTEGAAAALALCDRLDGVTVLLDAGALAAAPELVERSGATLLVGPNPREARRLLGDDEDPGGDDEDELADLAGRLAERLRSPVAVRGQVTVVDDGRGGRWSLGGSVPGLGTSGSGDVLVGLVAGLLARGAEPVTALAWGVAAHADAGAMLAVRTPLGFLAREVADALPAVLVELERRSGHGGTGGGVCETRPE